MRKVRLVISIALGLNLGQLVVSYLHMSRRELARENVRNIQKSKRSYYITLPIRYVRELGWREGQRVVVKKASQKLTVEDWRD